MTSSEEPTTSPPVSGPRPHDLAELPPPRRPWRRATLVTLAAGTLASISLAFAVVPDVLYSFRGGPPRDLGDLVSLKLEPSLAGSWVRGEGQLSATRAIRYARPLEHDTYRLASVDGNPKLWVQIRVPANEEGPRFVPPDSFVGRLLPMSELGIRQRGLPDAVGKSGVDAPANDAWLLVDGESPAALRWALGLLALLLAFATFNVVGLVRLTRAIPANEPVT
ncbi:MAG TPA: hypothetical protein VMI54_25465 [Polyangiaceae bacterium]|nr:hypothetical protein [Polyangiaceae bacterium]